MMLINEKELINYKSRDKIPFGCHYCKCTFYISKNIALAKLNGTKKNGVKYCSPKCYYASKNSSAKIECRQCGGILIKQKYEFKRSKNHFCSRSCSASYNNIHKKFGIKRSKLEKFLEENLIKTYPHLEIHFNRKDTINSELDIYIPSLKIAFELNGIFHYKPIYGENKLKSIQNNDFQKLKKCEEKEIKLNIINTYNNENLKNKDYLNIILNLINEKLNQIPQ